MRNAETTPRPSFRGGRLHRFAHAQATWITRRPGRVLAVSLLVVAALCLGMAKLTFRSDSRVFFAQDNPDLVALERFDATYGRDDTLVFVIRAREGDLFTTSRLRAINELTDAAWTLADVKRVDSFTNFQRAQAVGDDIRIDELARSGDQLTAAQARRLKLEATGESLLVGRLLSRDARLGLVAVNFRFDPRTASTQTMTAMDAGRKLADAFARAHGDLEIGLSGSVALDHAFVEASTFDTSVLLPAMVVVLLVILVLVLRSAAGAIATFCVIALGTLSALGTAALLGVPLSSPSVVAPNIILTIACCDCIHVCSGMLRLRRSGLDRRDAVRGALAECWWPVTLTTITTSIGFLSLVFSAVPPFAHLGIIVALGSVLTWALTLTFLPALLCVLPWRATSRPPPAETWSLRVAMMVMRRPGKVLASVTVVAVALCAFAFTNRLDDRYVRYFDQSYDFRRATDHLNEELGGFYTLEFSLDAGENDGIVRPDYLAQVDRFADWLRAQPGVTHVHGLPDVMKTVNRAINGGSDAQYRLPGSRDVAAQYLALYEMSLPFGTDLKNQLTADKRHSRLTVGLSDVSTAAMARLQERAQAWAARNTPLIAASARATGTSLLFAHIGNRNIHEMLKGVFGGVLVVWLIFLVAFRSVGLSLLGTVANFMPSVATLGAWALINGEVGMAVATVASVTFGVVVDDTIHMLTTYSRLRRDDVDTARAVRGAFEIAGPGMMAMTLALSAGFGCLAFSGFQINAWMGLMASVTILIALLFDLLFIPAALLVFRRDRPDAPATAVAFGEA